MSNYTVSFAQSAAEWARAYTWSLVNGQYLQLELKMKVLDSLEPISNPSFLSTFKLHVTGLRFTKFIPFNCYISNKAPNCQLGQDPIVLKFRLHESDKEGTVTKYYGAVKYFVKRYARDDVLAETDASIIRFIQLSNKSCISSARQCETGHFNMTEYMIDMY